MVDADHMVAAVEAYVRSYNRSDLDGVCAVFAGEAMVEDPVGTPPKVGQAALREFFAVGIAAGARLTLDGPVRCADGHAAFAFHVDLDWDGKATRIDVIDVFTFDPQGKVAHMKAYFGPANMGAA
jgi:steroid delta-isomerase